MLGLTIADDELLLESGSRLLHDAYPATQVEYRVLTPQEFGLPRIGHFGFFRSTHEESLWPLVSSWLHEQCAKIISQTGTASPPNLQPVPG